ncbi:MAG TPA: APC family permease, partial [Ignavibacteriaceae bacterium]|nr:APC family permease [Ignavibacteriaceae bacterium]
MNRLRKIFIGSARDVRDARIFHKLSLVAFLAWVGLGSDGLSSSCYGPPEAFLSLGNHSYLSIFVALCTGITILIIASSYKQIIEIFPTGGGGYLVASKLLSPHVGMVAGSALLIDYVLTITLSIASGADAVFSFLPIKYHVYKFWFAIFGVILLLWLNLRGIKEAVVPLVPVFLSFIFLHIFAFVYAFIDHGSSLTQISMQTSSELSHSYTRIGLFGILFIIMRAFSMGAGTFTGIEAVSNGLPILREPRVMTARKTMNYMAVSLSLTVFGLMLGYLLYSVSPVEGKTLNAIFFESLTRGWSANNSLIFVTITLLSEALLLFIAAQTGFLDGPRVLANMALDRWLPSRFAMLSDRLVTQNGIMLMGAAALTMMIISGGSVEFLVVLYSINVFITFTLSQTGMVRHWWIERKSDRKWKRKLLINGIGLSLSVFVLFTILYIKFDQGGWITLVVTSLLVVFALIVKRHYNKTKELFRRLDTIVDSVEASIYNLEGEQVALEEPQFDPQSKTAVVLVNGFNGLGLHTLLSIFRLFGSSFKNFVFLQVGAVDAGNFKGSDEIKNLTAYIEHESNRYVKYMKEHSFYAESFTSVGNDIVDEV